ncbi:hypothetical protein LZC95_39515 [Pendulispora brunnea]|uniref:Uncharacterized protein n=1 Tax=Pendulispora brunnea TaxID=2905690 RepID=A0ABZ2K831_9BACT
MRNLAKLHSFFFIAGTIALAHTGHAHTDPSALDPTWGGTGKVTTDLEGTNQDDYATAVLPQPDGRVVVVGSVIRPPVETVGGVVRYDESGQLDTSFGNGGRIVLP